MEFYDFFIYGTAAALVFGEVFFPGSSPASATFLALATFGVAYVARPVGAVVLGHVGDRFGRKPVLVFTIVLMGGATFAIGFLPSYDQAGALAPALLVACRLMQGFSAGGEQAGANSMALEHAPEHRRAFFSSFTLSGIQAGHILGTAVFLPVALLPEEALLSWGWRVPFWASLVVVVAGVLIRRTLHETPVFKRERGTGEPARRTLPITTLFRDHWRNLLRVTLASTVASVSALTAVWALSFAVNTVDLDRSRMLWVGIVGYSVALAVIPLFGILADRIGRRPVFAFGALGSSALLFAYFAAIATGDWLLIFGAGIALFGVVYSATAVWPAFYGEMFPAGVRLSGMAIGTQIGFAVGGFAPAIAAAVAGQDSSGWLPVAALGALPCLLAAGVALTARETARLTLADLEREQRPNPVDNEAADVPSR